jgi:sugar phosphate isomerase/epimerase
MASDEYYAYHQERGLSVPASEVILEWASPERAASAENARIIDLSARAGARTVIVAALEELGSFDAAARGLAELCDRAGERGLDISLEFLPFGGILTIAAALRLIEAADRENLGLVLDVWHWSRQAGGPDFATLAQFPPERLHILQLNDAAAEPAADLLQECANRLLPGEGDADIAALLAAIGRMGAAPVVITEVFSQSLAALDPAENARRQYAAAAAVLWGAPAGNAEAG